MENASIAVNVAANGRMVLPAKVRKAMGIEGESRIFVELEDGVVRLETTDDRIKRAQALYRKYVKNPSTVDDFLRERAADEVRRDKVLSGQQPD